MTSHQKRAMSERGYRSPQPEPPPSAFAYLERLIFECRERLERLEKRLTKESEK